MATTHGEAQPAGVIVPPVLDAKELNELAEFAELGGLGMADA